AYHEERPGLRSAVFIPSQVNVHDSLHSFSFFVPRKQQSGNASPDRWISSLCNFGKRGCLFSTSAVAIFDKVCAGKRLKIAPYRPRTYNPLIKSQLLCQLS